MKRVRSTEKTRSIECVFSVQGDYVFDRASFFFCAFCVKRKSVIDYDIATIRIDFYLNALSFIRKDTTMIEAGMKAPDFTLKDGKGKEVSLSSFLGKKVILYFYPKDNTPGCTRQACAFAGAYEKFKNIDAEVIGISKDSVASHEKFAAKYSLPFILLSDPELEAIKAYGVWQEKKLYGKLSMGVMRSTFIIDENGIIEKVMPKVKPDTNAEEILAYLRADGE